jgi:hypothetical protein
MEIWIMSNPVPRPPFLTTYDEFEHDFIESWTDTNEPHRAATELNKLRMKNDDIDTYITVFAELARKALYSENDPAVLEIFKTGLPLELLEKCMHHDEPHSWDAWTRSARVRQAILTSLKAHRTDAHERATLLIQVTPSTPPTIPPPEPMQCDKVSTYVVPARRNQRHETEKQRERRQGLCHKCGGKGHIEKCCPKALEKALEPITKARAAPSIPLVQDQGWRRPRKPTRKPKMTPELAIEWLSAQTPETRDEMMAKVTHRSTRRDFYQAQARRPLRGLFQAVRSFRSLVL